MRTVQEILLEVFTPTGLDCQTVREDLRLAIALNPSLELIEDVIKISMKEAIEESAAICHEHMDSDCFDGEGAEANILNLINELK